MKKTAKNPIAEYLAAYINVGGFWSPRSAWKEIWDGQGVPQTYQNHFMCGPAYSREELGAAGAWMIHDVAGIRAITG